MSLADKLSRPFPTEDLEWRAGTATKDKTKCLALPYITARAAQERLDEVFGVEGWKVEYFLWAKDGIKARIYIWNPTIKEWVYKEDGADQTKIEPTKGGFSDSFKRACVVYGIGRYLYKLPQYWVKCSNYKDNKGNLKVKKMLETPAVPDWATPEGWDKDKLSEATTITESITSTEDDIPHADTLVAKEDPIVKAIAKVAEYKGDVKAKDWPMKLYWNIVAYVYKHNPDCKDIKIASTDLLKVLSAYDDVEGLSSFKGMTKGRCAAAYGKLGELEKKATSFDEDENDKEINNEFLLEDNG